MVLASLLTSEEQDGLTWFPTYIVHARTDVLSLWAPSGDAARSWGTWWLNPPDTSPPRVSLDDRRLVNEVWWASAWLPPQRSANFKTPTLAEWAVAVAANRQETMEPAMHAPVPVSNHVVIANGDHPDWRPTWNIYTVYLTKVDTYAWYRQAATKADADAWAKSYWVSTGVYGTGKPVPEGQGSQVPARPWAALRAMSCEPAPHQYLNTSNYGKRTAVDWRLAAAVATEV